MSMNKLLRTGALLAALVVFLPLAAGAEEASDNDVAKDMAVFFRSARAVISKHQTEINNPALGDKGLTGDVVVAEAKANYKETAGHDLVIDPATRTGQFVQAEIDAVLAVMKDAQAVINEKGKGFKGFVPAVFGGQVARKTTELLKGRAEVKLTAPKDLIRNRSNRPDEWETNAIEVKAKAPGYAKEPISETGTKNGKAAFRLLLPEYYAEGCLSCHGEPKGETDISGGKKEGAKLGDLGGAISVTIYK